MLYLETYGRLMWIWSFSRVMLFWYQRNVDVAELNDLVLNQFPGDVQEFRSADQVDDLEHRNRYPTEPLNSLNPSELPPHTLKLKVGCPVILLWNLNTAHGLCNGTRIIVRSFHPIRTWSWNCHRSAHRHNCSHSKNFTYSLASPLSYSV